MESGKKQTGVAVGVYKWKIKVTLIIITFLIYAIVCSAWSSTLFLYLSICIDHSSTMDRFVSSLSRVEGACHFLFVMVFSIYLLLFKI